MEENPTDILKKKPKERKESIWELARFALIAVIIVVPIRIFIAQPFVVSGSSMVPTFEDGDYLIIDEISYRLGEPERGDVVIFRYPEDPKKFFIKRIVGLPSEKIQIKGNQVMIFNAENEKGFYLNEEYVKNGANNNLAFNLADDEYFVMGDNRIGSSDSRQWGPVHEDLMIGRALLRLLPIAKIDVMPGDYKEDL